ncbi:MAG TPA: hypothetical protein VIO94_08190 [Phenylobacterium sp.]
MFAFALAVLGAPRDAVSWAGAPILLAAFVHIAAATAVLAGHGGKDKTGWCLPR